MTTNSTDDILLDVRGLDVDVLTPEGPRRVVHSLDLTLRRRGTLGIVGESGSGKSMTATAVMGILPETAIASGQVLYRGRDLLSLPARERRAMAGREMGFVFQEPMSALHPTKTIGAQMAAPLRLHLGLTRRQARARSAELLDLVGIPPSRGVLDAYVHQLSGGMRQRVMIAMSISCEPDLLIADEPTTALDATIQKQILDLLAELREELGLSVLLISHDLGLVSRYTDDVVVMLDGHAMESGPTDRVVSAPESGYTRGLLEASPRLGDSPDRLPVIDKSRFTKAVQ
ncbi:ABC transporter ATP-binding protein [Nocardiopsis sp. L17-MgMaSL7]|uniref:ABC transporter ATP-binding protein n=1 Tax=Nocardiopsis sp. L17-MgMaSL7 TaxID=1938893 RepID=UPI000D714907|nr:ABC transporter ATP-binding protein [Nocardiopsis sp. L17-MgMaSL7]PWV54868.1 peptide/nickel transport system ATP-binding protein [Nocardiopsis sp. L17-MgMaSL7]